MKATIYALFFVFATNICFGQDKPIIIHTHTFVEMDIDRDLLTKKYVLGTISIDIQNKKIIIKANNLESIYTIIEISKHSQEGDNAVLSFDCTNKTYIRLDIKNKHALRVMVFTKPIPNDPGNYKAIKAYINFEISKPLQAMGDF